MNSLLQFIIYTFIFNWSAVSTYIIDNNMQHNISRQFFIIIQNKSFSADLPRTLERWQL